MNLIIAAADPGNIAAINLAGDLLIPVIVGLLAGSVGAVLVSQTFASADRRRDHYAEAVAVLLSWCEFPYMIRRRVDDEPATLRRLADHGHELQERFARAEAWTTAESKEMGRKYTTLGTAVKKAIGPLLQEAWVSSPVTKPADMNLNGWGLENCSEARQQINEFRLHTSRRFGWRRLLHSD